MKSYDVKPRRGDDTYRIGDSDDLVLMENMGPTPPDKVYLENHGLIIICTQGEVRFEYDGKMVEMKKNDMLLYMVFSMATKFELSPDFNCKMIWFTRAELWDMNIFSKVNVSDMMQLKIHPVTHLSEEEMGLMERYFHLLCDRMKNSEPKLQQDIVRSLFGTMLLEMLSLMLKDIKQETVANTSEMRSTLHKKQIVEKFLTLVEESDGRKRRVDEYASLLNITPKYLSTILKEVMNRRPSVYIQHYTMKAIEHRLRFTEMTMQEIAYDLNFPNSSFFNKYCKDHLGMTPLEYRTKYLRGKMHN
jgi:AraC-like DNA-binding protein